MHFSLVSDLVPTGSAPSIGLCPFFSQQYLKNVIKCRTIIGGTKKKSLQCKNKSVFVLILPTFGGLKLSVRAYSHLFDIIICKHTWAYLIELKNRTIICDDRQIFFL